LFGFERLFPTRGNPPPDSPATVQSIAPPAETRSSPPDSDPCDWLLGFAGPPSIAGPEVSPLTALGVPAVRAAVELIAGVMGTLPVNLYRPAGGGGKEVADDQPGQSLVCHDANGWTNAGEFRTALTVDALLQGSGYGLVIRDGEGNPRELHRLPPYAVVVTIDPITSEPSYRFNIGQEGGNTYSYRDIIHITPVARMDGINGLGYLTGLSQVRTARQAIGLWNRPRTACRPPDALWRPS
jgi:phage portal protein BeeE